MLADNEKKEETSKKAKLRWPLKGEVIRDYEEGVHDGIDIAVSAGTYVRSAASGTVLHAGLRWHDEYGETKTIIVQHHDELVALYANLADIYVKVGHLVRAGQIIGKI